MAKRGRPEVPDSLKLANGTWREDRHGPKPTVQTCDDKIDVPQVPDTLSDSGKRKWAEHAERLVNLGVLTKGHLDQLESYCMTFDEEDLLQAEIRKHGTLVQSVRGMQLNPALTQLNQVRNRRDRIARLFGFTPVDGRKIVVKNQTDVKQGVTVRKRG